MILLKKIFAVLLGLMGMLLLTLGPLCFSVADGDPVGQYLGGFALLMGLIAVSWAYFEWPRKVKQKKKVLLQKQERVEPTFNS